MLGRCAFRATALRRLGTCGHGASRMSIRRITTPPTHKTPTNAQLFAATALLGATAIYAHKTHGFNITEQANEYYGVSKPAEANAVQVEPEQPAPPPPVVVDFAKVEKADITAPYVLIGGGTASFAALKAIQESDPKAKVLIITDEDDPPYMRPPLSKELWYTDEDYAKQLRFKDWNGNVRDIFFKPMSFYSNLNDFVNAEEGAAGLLTGTKVTGIDVDRKLLSLYNGEVVQYNKLLLATGGRPRNLDVLETADRAVRAKTTLFRNVNDFKKLNDLTKSIKSVTIVGGGFTSSELAVALGHKAREEGLDLEVNQVFRDEGNMSAVFPAYLSRWTTRKLQEEGVNVLPRSVITAAAPTQNNRVELTLADGSSLVTDHVLVAVGIEPNSDLADAAGLEVDAVGGGIMANAELASRTDVYVAGDVASFHDPALGRRRVEHHDHAVVSGRLAGENMANGELRKPYRHQSMFWSDLGPNVGYEAIGITDSRLDTVSVWAMSDKSSAAEGRDMDREQPGNDDATPANEEGTENVEDVSSPVAMDTATDSDDSAPSENASSVSLSEEEEFDKGVVFYLRDQKVVGILLWNVFGKIPLARKIIGEKKTVEETNELAKLFNVHS